MMQINSKSTPAIEQPLQFKQKNPFKINEMTLSLDELRTDPEKLIKQTKKEDRINILFYMILKFAENPIENICGRYIWARYSEKFHLKYTHARLSDTVCEITRGALLGAVFGTQKERRLKSFDDEKKEMTLEKAWKVIEDSQEKLTQGVDFIAYSFGITEFNQFAGHAFLVIQYLDENHQVGYKLFQSFVRQYSLEDYLKQNANHYTHTEFKKFYAGLTKCVTEAHWTEELEQFYTSYFKVKCGFELNQENPCSKGDFAIEWSEGKIKEVFKHEQRFLAYRSSSLYPLIELVKPIS